MGSFWFEYEEDGSQETFSFDGENIAIGREQSQDFVLDHPTVSRQHAVIIDDGGGEFRLVVLSQGGLTAVDGERVEGEAQLYDGVQLHFGKLAFRFRSDQAPAKPSGGGSASAGGPQSRGGPQISGGTTGSGGAPTERSGEAAAGSPGGNAGGAEASGGDQTSNTVNSSERAGIASWDEIAESAKEEEEEEKRKQQQSTSTSGSFDDDLRPHQPGESGGSGEEEQTNPLVVIVGILGIVGTLAYSFWPRGGGPQGPTQNPLEQKDPQAIVEVKCLSKEKCLKEAKASYRVGNEYLEKKDSEVGNLFQGYKRLLESKAYLEKAETESKPEELSDLQERIDKARKQLDKIFRNYQVKFRSAQKNDQPREMASALQTIQRYFPDKKAPEYQWANKRILRMKRKGTYPSNL